MFLAHFNINDMQRKLRIGAPEKLIAPAETVQMLVRQLDKLVQGQALRECAKPISISRTNRILDLLPCPEFLGLLLRPTAQIGSSDAKPVIVVEPAFSVANVLTGKIEFSGQPIEIRYQACAIQALAFSSGKTLEDRMALMEGGLDVLDRAAEGL